MHNDQVHYSECDDAFKSASFSLIGLAQTADQKRQSWFGEGSILLQSEAAPGLDLRLRPSSGGRLGSSVHVGERVPEMDSSGRESNLYAGGLRSATRGSSGLLTAGRAMACFPLSTAQAAGINLSASTAGSGPDL
ncbi:hypothetical protein MHYP_G00316680 [Metynnis hypsauchen]